MARVKGGPLQRRRHKKTLKAASGYNQGRRRLYRRANEAVTKARAYAHRDRRNRKRDFRRLWIQRINAASRQHGMSYGVFMFGLKQAGVELDRKVLADMAARDPLAFAAIAEVAREGAGDRAGEAPASHTELMLAADEDDGDLAELFAEAEDLAESIAEAEEAAGEAEDEGEDAADE